MARMNDVYPSKYLKASDLSGPTRSQIGVVTVEPVGENKELKFVAALSGQEKSMVLNVTSSRFLTDLTGSDDSDYWTGTHVMLVPTKVQMGTKIVDSIRLDLVPRVRAAKPPKAAIPAAVDEADTEVGF